MTRRAAANVRLALFTTMTLAAAVLFVARGAAAQSESGAAPPFPAEITLIVGFSPGQGIDQPRRPEPGSLANLRASPDASYIQSARFLSVHLGRFLPSTPKILVRNMPGAGGLVAARHLVEVAPADGSTLALLGPNPFFASLRQATDLQKAFGRIAYVGTRTRETFMCFAWYKSILRRLDDARAYAGFAGTLGAGSRGQAHLEALNKFAGTQFRIVAGYSNAFDVSRSLENGEIEAACGYTMNLLQTRHGNWLRDGKIALLTRFGLAPFAWRTPVPDASDEVQDDLGRQDLGRQVMGIFDIEGDLVWALAAPPAIPPNRLAELREAFDTMFADPEVIAAALREGLTIEPLSGVDLQAEVARAYALPSEALGQAQILLDAK
jgi:tripartite-type tricarboxylate transporter receptor subunit TctC